MNSKADNTTHQSDLKNLSTSALDELHRIAQRCMNKENPGHTLQATALVNEAYLSLRNANVETLDKLHFFALAATHMRRILVDHARQKNAKKREAQGSAISADDEALIDFGNTASLVLLDEVLTQFSILDERAAAIYEMKLFAGLNNAELAEVFGISTATIERDLRLARAWINQQFSN